MNHMNETMLQLNPHYCAMRKRYDMQLTSLLKYEHPWQPARLLKRGAELFGKRRAVECGTSSASYEQLYTWACAVSNYLAAQQEYAGTKIMLYLHNSVEYYAAYYGAWQTGAVIAPINSFLSHKELGLIIGDCVPAALITSKELASTLEGIIPATTRLVILEDAMAYAHTQPFAIPLTDPDDLTLLLYTSGTTGLPKGVMLSGRAIMTNVLQAVSATDVHAHERILSVLPLFHSFAQNVCLWTSVFIGATAILIPKIERKNILAALKQEPTALIGVPAVYGLLALMRNIPLDSIRFFISGGDALPDKIRMAFELIYRRKLCNGYGLTEAAPFIAVDFEDELKPTSTIGIPAVGLACSLRDEDGNEVPPEQIGILWVKGDNVMLGYYHAPEATAAVMKDGWLNTGDFARFDRYGRLVIEGRHKDLIINKGFNIYPPEIENIIMSHPLVTMVAVVGKDDPSVGQVPVAFVVVKERSARLEEEIKALCAAALAGYKVPKQIIIKDALPLTSLSKIDKKKLRLELVNENE
jgi:long-chain acyl-CoA synthetase